MNPLYLGDSYDLVKRFWCRELSNLGYAVAVDPMFTGEWNGREQSFLDLIGAETAKPTRVHASKSALFLDPDTGVNSKGGPKHVSYERLASEAKRHDLVFSFDQSFSRQHDAATVMDSKLTALHALGCHVMYYDSHARFLFAATDQERLDELHAGVVALGLPTTRIRRYGA